MTDKKFSAILAKNDIARELKSHMDSRHQEPVNVSFLLYCLRTIEAYLGEGNQPSIDEIINNITEYRI